MNFIILDRVGASKFKPLELTLVIRILDCNDARLPLPLEDSNFFIRPFLIYRFDDAVPKNELVGLMGRDVTLKLLSDYSCTLEKYRGLKQTLVHCNEGQGRSPAVAGALRHIFFENFTHYDVSIYHPDYNEYVYREIVNSARLMKIGRLIN